MTMKIVNYSYDWPVGQDSTVTIDFEIDSSDHKTKKHIRMITIGRTTVEELD